MFILRVEFVRANPPTRFQLDWEKHMRILIAEDDNVSQRILESFLVRWGFQVEIASDGEQAWWILSKQNPPSLAILDWMMPGLDGIEVCRRLRTTSLSPRIYIILLTARGTCEDIVRGLDAGADDYICKPFNRGELRARIDAGVRVVELQLALQDRVRELELALAKVKQLQGLFPICSYCKKIRDAENFWQQVENYISEHSEAQFSHGICPECYAKFVMPELEKLPDRKESVR